MNQHRVLSRRSLLRGAGAMSLAAAAAPLVAACGSGAGGGGDVAANARLKLPTYVPFAGVKPDLPFGDNLLPGFYGYPADPAAAVTGKPGEGAGKVDILVNTFTPVPPAPGSNKYWQALNERVGAELAFNIVPDADYGIKLSTTLTGGDLPDLVMLQSWTPNLPAVLKAKFADLTPYLSGDAVKEYPFLANIPEFSWRPMVANGGIYGLPTPRAGIGNVMFTRDDLIAQRSLNPAPKSFEEFVELCEGLTDAKGGRWALGDTGVGGGGALMFALTMAGAPNGWAVKGGKFTNAVETDSYTRALEAVASMVKRGLFHPDAFSATFQQGRDWFGTGKIALKTDGYAAWDILLGTYPGIDVGAMAAPAYDGGGKSRHFTGPGSFAVTGVKKGDEARIKQLLSIANWMAAPFGTAEHLFRKFGVEGVDYTLQNGVPTPTKQGETDVKIPMNYLIDQPPVLGPGKKSVVDKQYAFHKQVAPLLVEDPTVGLYSTAQAAKGSALSKILSGALSEIVRGNKPASDWSGIVRDWRRSGGDQVRKEFEAAYAQQH
ncbi:extracellular solute-binding protein [Streptomyces sp. IB2014 016-6]|uniref:extracellular solute-binding protein n=1 Tax=Streptomyces sp. IB2014 016-6 TaxID=2517818 RepID=UPI0016506181|nr:extracellular solute-binding protein [Streptomyces sp. IB2014 016-6]